MAVVFCIFIFLHCSKFTEGSTFQPVVHEASSSFQCGQSDIFEDDNKLMESLKTIRHQIPPPGCNPLSACSDIPRCYSSASSGYYQIKAANGSAVQAYCDTEGTNCGGEGGWMRVAYLNMTDPSSQCPVGFRVETANKRFCIRNTSSGGCSPILAESFGLNYSKVCGYVRGYSYYTLDGFETIPGTGHYVDGVSITYGNPDTHLWTYAAGLQEANSINAHRPFKCPCNTQAGHAPPSFVGSNYYCESGSLFHPDGIWYTNDPLWDGMQCGGDEGPCCNPTGLPWFIRNIPTNTTATIKVRVCLDEASDNENIGIERLQLYVK